MIHQSRQNAPLAKALAETLHRVEDMEQRIRRQQERIERARTVGIGPVADLRELLADMVRARELMQARVDSLEAEVARAGRSPAPELRRVKTSQPRAPRRKHSREKIESDLAVRFWMELLLIEQGSIGIVRHLRTALGGNSPSKRVLVRQAEKSPRPMVRDSEALHG